MQLERHQVTAGHPAGQRRYPQTEEQAARPSRIDFIGLGPGLDYRPA